jgi:flavocytochrome c
MSAANTIVECGGSVVLLDKSSFCGGNSTKATSGINGAGTRTQKAQGITDSSKIFIDDTLRGGAKKPELCEVLCSNSGPDVEWLMDAFDLDLSLVARLGGHSQPRTHRGKERFPGMTITYALIEMLEAIADNTPYAKIITKANVTSLIFEDKKVVGVSYERDGKTTSIRGPVILCTGGFGADFTKDSILGRYRKELLSLPTTNGDHTTGDGIKLGEAVGAATIDLEWVQVHPTGLVNPSDPEAKVKFLAAEALRGVGGILLDKNGERFANELGRRDYVTGMMWKNQGPFRLILNSEASNEIHWHCEHYKGRGIMEQFNSGEALASAMGIKPEVLKRTFEDHTALGKKMTEDPNGGTHQAYPTGTSHDKWGKKFFTNYEFKMADVFHVAIVTPVIHYCMGGLEINKHGEVLESSSKKPIQGLYAAGELAGGVHGENRLGGSSLLDCVVYGRVTGRRACATFLKGGQPRVLKSLAAKGQPKQIEAPGASASKGEQTFTVDEVAQHTSPQDCWVIIGDKVLDVTSFLKDHPGGELAILTFAGKDATAEFNMIHPPNVIEKYAPESVIGTLAGSVTTHAPALGGGGYVGLPTPDFATEKRQRNLALYVFVAVAIAIYVSVGLPATYGNPVVTASTEALPKKMRSEANFRPQPVVETMELMKASEVKAPMIPEIPQMPTSPLPAPLPVGVPLPVEPTRVKPTKESDSDHDIQPMPID